MRHTRKSKRKRKNRRKKAIVSTVCAINHLTVLPSLSKPFIHACRTSDQDECKIFPCMRLVPHVAQACCSCIHHEEKLNAKKQFLPTTYTHTQTRTPSHTCTTKKVTNAHVDNPGNKLKAESFMLRNQNFYYPPIFCCTRRFSYMKLNVFWVGMYQRDRSGVWNDPWQSRVDKKE